MTSENVNTSYLNWQPIVEYRIGVDPTSNPDPSTGGLIVNASQTRPAPTIFNVPLTTASVEGLGFGNNFVYDPTNAFTVGADTITCNRAGRYRIELQFDCLSARNLDEPELPGGRYAIFQIVAAGQPVFTGPPAISSGGRFTGIGGSPIAPLYNEAVICSGSAGVQLEAGDVVACVFYLAAGTCVIALTSNISIQGA